MQKTISNQPGLKVVEGLVEDLLIYGSQVVGIRTLNEEYFAETIIITTGTFL